MDICHKIAETGVDVEVRGSTDFSSLRGSTVVVITAGLARKPGMTRMDLLEKNAGIVAVGRQGGREARPGCIAITVTNPMDVMNYVVLRKTGFPKGRVVGMGGILDLSRFKSRSRAMLDVSHSSITSLVIGEHGENMLPLARYTSIGGVPLTKLMDETQIAQAMESDQADRDRRHLEEGRDRRRPGERGREDGQGHRMGPEGGAPCLGLPRGRVRRERALHRRPAGAGRQGRREDTSARPRREGEGSVLEGGADDTRRHRRHRDAHLARPIERPPEVTASTRIDED